MARKAEQKNDDIVDDEYDEVILDFLMLLSVICGQPLSLSAEEKGITIIIIITLCLFVKLELLDEQTFITMMIQFATDEWYIDEYSEISFAAAVALVYIYLFVLLSILFFLLLLCIIFLIFIFIVVCHQFTICNTKYGPSDFCTLRPS